MIQRIFDVDNPQDVKDLFDILPDDVKKVRWLPDDTAGILDKDGIMIHTDFIRIAWRDKTEITRPVDESKWIGCLCWFWDYNYEVRVMNLLSEIIPDSVKPYISVSGISYQNCLPVKRHEIKFVEDV